MYARQRERYYKSGLLEELLWLLMPPTVAGIPLLLLLYPWIYCCLNPELPIPLTLPPPRYCWEWKAPCSCCTLPPCHHPCSHLPGPGNVVNELKGAALNAAVVIDGHDDLNMGEIQEGEGVTEGAAGFGTNQLPNQAPLVFPI